MDSNKVEITASNLYEAYCVAVGGKAWNGDPLPSWAEFGSDPNKQLQANGWRKVAQLALELPQGG